MATPKRLRLDKDVLSELDLAGISAGDGTLVCELPRLTLDTCFSCMTYISCNPAACVIREVTETVIAVGTGLDCV